MSVKRTTVPQMKPQGMAVAQWESHALSTEGWQVRVWPGNYFFHSFPRLEISLHFFIMKLLAHKLYKFFTA